MENFTLALIALVALLLIIRLLLWRRGNAPQFVPKKTVAVCRHALQSGNDPALFDGIDRLIEMTAKSTRQLDLVASRAILRGILELPEYFVQVTPRGPEMADVSMLDRVNYLAAYLLRRLEWLFQTALGEHVEPVAEEILTTYAKISLSFAKFYPKLAFMPLVFLERSIQIALEKENGEVAARAEVILSELVKNFIALSQEKNESLQELIFRTLSHLERGVKASFEKNNKMGVALMMQPFAEIASFIVTGKYASFPNRDEVIGEIRRYLQQFSALESVLQKSEEMDDVSSAQP